MKKIFCALLVVLGVSIAQAQTAGIVGPIVTGAVTKFLVDDINQKLTERISQAATSGDFLLEKSAREIQMLLANADTMFNDDLNKTFDKLTTQQQEALRMIVQMTNDLQKLADQAMSIEQFAAMDLNTVLGKLPGVKGDAFLLRQIGGYSQPYREKGVYAITLTGQAFAQGRKLAVSINGKPVNLLPFSKDYVAAAEVPVEVLNDLFKDTEVNRVALTIQSWDQNGFIRKALNKKEKLVLNYSGEMLLLPRKPLKYELLEVTAGKGWSEQVSSVSNIALAAATGESGRWKNYAVSVAIPKGTLMLQDKTRVWVASGVGAGPWGNFIGPFEYTDMGPQGPERVSRQFAHQIHDQNRTIAIEAFYRTPVVIEGRKQVELKDPFSNTPVKSLEFDKMYEGALSADATKYFLRLTYFNGKEVVLDTQSPNPAGIELKNYMLSATKSVTIKVKNPY